MKSYYRRRDRVSLSSALRKQGIHAMLSCCGAILPIVSCCLENAAFGGLRQLSVVERCHLPSNFYQNSLEATIPTPMSKDSNLVGIDLPIRLVHKWQVDSRYELNLGWLIGIRFPTNDLETVDAILVYGMTWTNDSAIPLTHQNIVPVLQTVWTRPIADAFFAFLKLFEEPKIARDLGHEKEINAWKLESMI